MQTMIPHRKASHTHPRNAGVTGPLTTHSLRRVPSLQCRSFHTGVRTPVLFAKVSESHHHCRRRHRQSWRKSGSSRPSLPRHVPTLQLRWRWRLSASRPAGALIDFGHVCIIKLHFMVARNLHMTCRYGCPCHTNATWCIPCQPKQGGPQGDGDRIRE